MKQTNIKTGKTIMIHIYMYNAKAVTISWLVICIILYINIYNIYMRSKLLEIRLNYNSKTGIRNEE